MDTPRERHRRAKATGLLAIGRGPWAVGTTRSRGDAHSVMPCLVTQDDGTGFVAKYGLQMPSTQSVAISNRLLPSADGSRAEL
ncbi:hypothetical protein QF035_002166 [Streptomyces umbrinus]|uniref:Uncharacterized protein n=1 Tax=Streptomyces umbrinus TaxID=67370 RepID=A0ABU0SM13_9ACTN|nr:hypothetical protein [Streptomyces umbrinus]